VNQQPLFQNPGQSYWIQRHIVKTALPRLEAFSDAFGSIGGNELRPPDYPQLFAIATAFRPDIIVEVGRLHGNSTCILTEAANHLGGASVYSVCLTDKWFTGTLDKIRDIISPEWLQKLDARVMNFVDLDVESLLEGKQRVLFLLDAHGWEVAEYMLAVVMPQLVKREHLVLVHDIFLAKYRSDYRKKYYPEDDPVLENYRTEGVWKGTSASEKNFLFLNGLGGLYPEFLAFVDFAERNRLRLRVVEEDVRHEIENNPDRRAEMVDLLGERMYSPFSAYAWMTLNGRADTSDIIFPRYKKIQNNHTDKLASLLCHDLGRHNFHGRPTLLTYARILAKGLLKRYNV